MKNESINYYRIEKAIAFLSDNFKNQPDLDEIASKVFMSPFHFQRVFTEWSASVQKIIQYLTIDYLRNKIGETENMVAAAIGRLVSQSRVHDLFVTIEGVSPQQYKTSGKDLKYFTVIMLLRRSLFCRCG